jgi:hypothetical protein
LLKASVDAFQHDATFAHQELQHYDASLIDNDAKVLIKRMQDEAVQLQEDLTVATALGVEVQKYFSASHKAQANLPPMETFFGHIADFMVKFEHTWLEVERNPGRFALYSNVAMAKGSKSDTELGTPNASGKSDSEAESARQTARKLAMKQRSQQFRSSLRKSDCAEGAEVSES